MLSHAVLIYEPICVCANFKSALDRCMGTAQQCHPSQSRKGRFSVTVWDRPQTLFLCPSCFHEHQDLHLYQDWVSPCQSSQQSNFERFLHIMSACHFLHSTVLIQLPLPLGMCGIDFIYFSSVSVRFLKNSSDSVWNELRLVRFGYFSNLLLMQ